MNISLPKALEQYVRRKVKNGQYASASEVIRDLIRQRQVHDQRVAEIRQKVKEGLDDADAGRYMTGEEFGAWVRKRTRELSKKRKAAG